MNAAHLARLEADLWEAADQLRANSKLSATEYSMPVLGLIFLRHATTRFDAVRREVEASLPTRGGVARPITKDDFHGRAAIYLPEAARYDRLARLPDSADLDAEIDEAMRLVEAESPDQLQGMLPKGYGAFEKDLLRGLVRIFDRDALRMASGDVFGPIYEYFLNQFAMSGAQEEGAFFTPPSLVRLIVNVIEPNRGTVLDPACGSAGSPERSEHCGRSASPSSYPPARSGP
jgi:type I restriction enzyme M protein